MPSALDDLIGRKPLARPLLIALAVVVLVADAVVLVGYTGQVSGTAVPAGPLVRHSPSAVAPSVPSAAVRPSAPAVSAAPSTPAVPSRTAPVPTTGPGVAPRSPSAVRPTGRTPSGSGRSGDRWPGTVPDPNDFTAKNPNSPFARRCRDGRIEAWLCRGYPRQGS
jgi:hypothetical protein